MSAREALQALLDRDKKLDPRVVVQEAEPETSPLHKHFQWDDDKAAALYRIEQAEELIRRVKVTVKPPDNAPITVRAFVNVRDNDEDKRGFYLNTQEALKSDFYRTQVLQRAVRDAKAFRTKYQGLDELSGILSSIDGFLEEIEGDDLAA